jgi:hypothetical protein
MISGTVSEISGRMSTKSMFLGAFLIASIGGCQSSVPTKIENVSGQKEHDMANCPSAVTGAYTSARNIDGGVEVTITGQKPLAIDAIRRLALEQAELNGQTIEVEHTGRGTGTGRLGYCPIVHPGTYVHVESIPGGARVFMTARKPADVSKLRDVVRRRVVALGGTVS